MTILLLVFIVLLALKLATVVAIPWWVVILPLAADLIILIIKQGPRTLA